MSAARRELLRVCLTFKVLKLMKGCHMDALPIAASIDTVCDDT